MNVPGLRLVGLSGACLAVTALSACGQAPNRIDAYEPEVIDATSPPIGPSALTVFSLLFDVAFDAYPGGCPSATQDGDTVIIEGGCTTESGVQIVGAMTHRGTPGYIGLGPITYDGFGTRAPTRCASRPGETFDILLDGAGGSNTTDTRSRFSANLEISLSGVGADCGDVTSEAGLVYDGHIDDWETSTQTWNGHGRWGEAGLGRTEIATVNAVLDQRVCATEILSGETSVVGDRTVRVFYDGATDCDVEATATWSLDGVMQEGELRGVL